MGYKPLIVKVLPEEVAHRRALIDIRRAVMAAIRDATIWQSASESPLWAALQAVDAECVAHGLETALDAGGGFE